MVDPFAKQLEFRVGRMRSCEILTGGDLDVVCRNAFARDLQVDDMGRNINGVERRRKCAITDFVRDFKV